MEDTWYFMCEGKSHSYASYEEAKQGKKEQKEKGKVCSIIMCNPRHRNG